jgi:hypothetical protein
MRAIEASTDLRESMGESVGQVLNVLSALQGSNLEPSRQTRLGLILSWLELEILGKPVRVATDCLVQTLHSDSIKRREIAIQHHPSAANQQDHLFDLFWLNQ